MIQDVACWQAWEDRYRAAQPIDVMRNLRMAEALHEAARSIGRKSDPLVDFQRRLAHKLRMTRAFNALSASRKARTGA
jgi:hypothetical protein